MIHVDDLNRYYDCLLDFLGIDGDEITELLCDTPFTWVIPMDSKRADDAISLRERLGRQDNEPASVMEVIAALSERMEFLWDDKSKGEWFNEMLDNLGFDDLGESVRMVGDADHILMDWMTRNINADGSGGLFPLNYPDKDQRRVDIWSQMSFYLEEYLEEIGFFND